MLHMSSALSITFDVPLVASPKQAMRAIQVSRKKLYELINTGELESYTEGKSRRITVKSINGYIERRLAAEAVRRGRPHEVAGGVSVVPSRGVHGLIVPRAHFERGTMAR